MVCSASFNFSAGAPCSGGLDLGGERLRLGGIGGLEDLGMRGQGEEIGKEGGGAHLEELRDVLGVRVLRRRAFDALPGVPAVPPKIALEFA